MVDKRIAKFTEEHLKKEKADFEVGDTVKVYQKVIEGDKTRTQLFEGTVIRMKGSGINLSFTVLKVSRADTVEKVFPFHSPAVEKVVVERKGKAKKACLYNLRKKKHIELRKT